MRRSATAEAARLLSGIVKESGARVRDAIWQEIKQKSPAPGRCEKASPRLVTDVMVTLATERLVLEDVPRIGPRCLRSNVRAIPRSCAYLGSRR